MSRSYITPVFLLLAALSGPLAASSLYDVSYLWTRNASAALDYRERVARLLGPAVAQDLKVAADGDLFGLLYHRRGDKVGADRVARAHSALLLERGLEPAAPMKSRDWRFLEQAPSTALPDVPDAVRAPPSEPVVLEDLEAAVEDYVKQLRAKGRISPDERTGWSVYDFTTGEKLVTINEETPFQAASLIKPFVAAAFFHEVERGELIYGPRSRRHMERMIQRSDNPSTNWIMRRVGGPRAVQRILTGNYPGIFRNTRIVEYIPPGGRTYRNQASARDYSRFLYAVWNGNLPGSGEIKRLMSLPGPDRIYTGAETIPPGTRVLNKTGSTAHLCADMGILSVRGQDGKRYPYTLIGIIEKQNKAENYGDWIRARGDVIREVSDIVYRGIAERHDFADVL